MGMTISYTIRLSRRAGVGAFLKAARAEARARGWRVLRSRAGTGGEEGAVFEASPHEKCEPVRLDFARSLACEWSVKTGGAPMRTHIEIVGFLRALEPLAKSMEVEDEGGFWETGDRAVLKRRRDEYARAMKAWRGEKAEGPPVTFTLGAEVVRAVGGSAAAEPGPAVRVTTRGGRGRAG